MSRKQQADTSSFESSDLNEKSLYSHIKIHILPPKLGGNYCSMGTVMINAYPWAWQPSINVDNNIFKNENLHVAYILNHQQC